MHRVQFVLAAALLFCSISAQAAVKSEQKTQVKFGGGLGKMMSLFGGKAAKEGVVDTVAVKGNRKITRTEDTGQIIDLDEEKVYDVDFKGKSYRVTTFDEIRRKFAEDQEKAKQQMAKMKDAPNSPPPPPPDQQMQVDLDVKNTGQQKTVDGFDCKEEILTVTMHQKGKSLEEAGGLVATSDLWLTPKIPGMQDVADFDRRYYEKLNLPFDPAMMQEMAQATAANPMLGQGMVKLKTEGAKLQGTAILTTMDFQAVAGADAAAQQQQQEQAQQQNQNSNSQNIPTSLGGLFGGLAKKAAQKKADQKQADNSDASAGRSSIMTSTTEYTKITSDVSDTDLAIPAGFKEKK